MCLIYFSDGPETTVPRVLHFSKKRFFRLFSFNFELNRLSDFVKNMENKVLTVHQTMNGNI